MVKQILWAFLFLNIMLVVSLVLLGIGSVLVFASIASAAAYNALPYKLFSVLNGKICIFETSKILS